MTTALEADTSPHAKLSVMKTSRTRSLASADCTAQDITTVTSALSTKSNGCTDATSYDWGGGENPTPTEYSQLCGCALDVARITAPTCNVMKGADSIALQKHVEWVLNEQCGKYEPSACTTKAISDFTRALGEASSGCTSDSSYEWGGSKDPTDAQSSELCACSVSWNSLWFPECNVEKGSTTILLSTHVKWALNTSCPTTSPPQTTTTPSVGTMCTEQQKQAYDKLLVTASPSCTAFDWSGAELNDNQLAKLCECAALAVQSKIPDCLRVFGDKKVALITSHTDYLLDCAKNSRRSSPIFSK